MTAALLLGEIARGNNQLFHAAIGGKITTVSYRGNAEVI